MAGSRDRLVPVIRVAAAIAVCLVALATRLLAVNVLPVDFDEDDYLRAGQQYAVGLQAGDPGVLLRDNYRPEHPPLAKIVTGLALVPMPRFAEVPDRPTTADPATDLPQPQLVAARTSEAVFGALAALLLAIVSPVGGLWLAVHTWSIKYTSQVMLEAVPAFFALLAVLAATRARGAASDDSPRVRRRSRRRWLLVAALALGLACAGKYLYGVAGLAIAADWLWRTRRDVRGTEGRIRPAAVPRWLGPVAAWFGLAFVFFLVADPYLWPDPVGRLASSIAYHGGYATSAAVQDTGWPSWQPLVWLMGSVPFHDRGTFLLTLDLPITLLAVVGARDCWRRHRVFALWFIIGFAFLLAWPTKWPQYVLVISAPLSLSAGLGTARILAPARDRLWGWLASAGRRLRPVTTGADDGPGDARRPTPAPRRAPRGARLRDLRTAAPWLAPGVIGLLVLAAIPLAFEFLMSLTDLHLTSLKDGLQGGVLREAVGGLTGQVQAVPFNLNDSGRQVHYVGLDLLNGFQQGFWLGGNTSAAYIAFSVLWMILSVGLQAALGIAVAIVLERPGMRLAGAWRTLFILPWAIPEVVAAVAWRDVFHPQQGLLVQLLGHDVRWDQSPELSLVVLLIASTWMGWPLWMLVATAGLRTIPRAVSEAAELDGASPWRRFAWVTLPLLLPLLGAAFVVRAVTAFNQFYLFYVMGPSDPTTTLSTFSFYVFDSTSGPGLYSVSAAINVVTLVALAVVVAWFLRWRSRAERVAFA